MFKSKDKFSIIERNILGALDDISEKNISNEFDSRGQRFMTIFLENKEYLLEFCGPLDTMRLTATSMHNNNEIIFEDNGEDFIKDCLKGFDKLKIVKKNYDSETTNMCITGLFTSRDMYNTVRTCKDLDIKYITRTHHQLEKQFLIISEPQSIAQWALAN